MDVVPCRSLAPEGWSRTLRKFFIMNYIDILKFYYPAGTTAGSDAPFKLDVKGKSVSGTQYSVVSWAPVVASTDPAVSTISITVEPLSNNPTKTIELGTHEVGLSKELTIIVVEGGDEKEREDNNYKDADPD